MLLSQSLTSPITRWAIERDFTTCSGRSCHILLGDHHSFSLKVSQFGPPVVVNEMLLIENVLKVFLDFVQMNVLILMQFMIDLFSILDNRVLI
jgi:hypothetical protein